MKKAVVVAFIIFFAVGMFHYFYAEDHCPVHGPSRAGGFGHVHQHHGHASTCLCFWTTLLGPENDDVIGAREFEFRMSPAASFGLCPPLGADIAHPPKDLLS
ncbi:MAG: hypothetical protein MUQ25_06710 [Candidatus Aminicenantes bacterium]|nr:hypothetical protein [Candidatus Aminicenantes bacterium]